MATRIKIVLEGDRACFTRPEFKVERMSYPVPPPGALEGLLKSIYWKPSMRYVIDKIVVFNQIRYTNVRCNEIKSKLSMSRIKSQMKKNTADYYIDRTENYIQRATRMLRDVKYGIEFHIELTGLRSEKEEGINSLQKHYHILKRRLEKGQYFRPPCLGMASYMVKQIECVNEFDMGQVAPENMDNIDLGFMLYRINFKNGGRPIDDNWDAPVYSEACTAQYYHPRMVNGVIDVEKYRRDVVC